MSYLASLLTNISIRTNGKQGAKLTEVKDFILDWDLANKKKGTQSVDEMKDMFKSFASAASNKSTAENQRRRRKPKRLRK